MNKFEFKNLVKTLEKSLKERTFFKTLRTEVNTGANGTQDYVVNSFFNNVILSAVSTSVYFCSKSLKECSFFQRLF